MFDDSNLYVYIYIYIYEYFYRAVLTQCHLYIYTYIWYLHPPNTVLIGTTNNNSKIPTNVTDPKQREQKKQITNMETHSKDED